MSAMNPQLPSILDVPLTWIDPANEFPPIDEVVLAAVADSDYPDDGFLCPARLTTRGWWSGILDGHRGWTRLSLDVVRWARLPSIDLSPFVQKGGAR